LPFGGTLHQIALAFVIGVAWALRKERACSEAADAGAKASFIVGAAWMLFSENRWWPAASSLLALVSWAMSGWLAARIGYELIDRAKN
jgi:hypothetical protein